jgi:hypothetical protein
MNGSLKVPGISVSEAIIAGQIRRIRLSKSAPSSFEKNSHLFSPLSALTWDNESAEAWLAPLLSLGLIGRRKPLFPTYDCYARPRPSRG